MTDPAEVAPTVLGAFGLREQALLYPGRAMQRGGRGAGHGGTRLTGWSAALAGRRALLVLDNCEHLVAARRRRWPTGCWRGCPGMRILATSREPLNINGEALWPVGPLSCRRTGRRRPVVRFGRAVEQRAGRSARGSR